MDDWTWFADDLRGEMKVLEICLIFEALAWVTAE
ncbi:hypothetical protein NC652_016282 [Populus alba x Populus x berolinensis]|nr:hypothetical protein NC652_016282 [Populus alba x Populus x berolinensis]